MKCPFRFITTQKDGVTTQEFGECYGKECPFYGKEVTEHRQYYGYKTTTKPCCRRTIREDHTNDRTDGT